MSISSRTPEGTPSHCPVCGALTPLDFSADTGDAACPACGCLLWKSAAAFDALRQWLEDQTEVETAGVTGTTHLREMDIDSLTLVELVMEVEEAYDISIPADQADKIRTVGDVVRFILENVGQE